MGVVNAMAAKAHRAGNFMKAFVMVVGWIFDASE
jgi:hypothetical protein